MGRITSRRHRLDPQFIRLAERVSGQQLDRLFREWLYRPHKPELTSSASGGAPLATANRPALRWQVRSVLTQLEHWSTRYAPR